MDQSSSSQSRVTRKKRVFLFTYPVPLLIVLAVTFLIPTLVTNVKGAARSRPKLQTGDLYALVVGISQFRDSRIPGLTLAAKDARSFGKFLETQKKVFKNIRVTYLVDEKATKTAVEKHLYYTLPKAGKNDTIILFFSGHGTYDPMRPKDFLFLAYDSEPDFLSATAVKMSGLEFLKGIEASRVLIIADACHAGGFSQMKHKGAPRSLELFLNEVRNSSGKAIITSGKEEQLSWEVPNLGHSAFTHNLIKGLKGEADTDHDGVVTLTEVYRYAYARTKDNTSGHQHPQFEGKVVGAFPLSYVGPAVPPAELRRRLHDATRNALVERIKLLIRSGVAVDSRDDHNNSPLIVSSAAGHSDVVGILLKHSANVDARNNDGGTALMKACEHGRLAVIRLLLRAGAACNVKDRQGFGPLALACRNGHAESAELLLDSGSDTQERTLNGETALHLAAAHGRAKAVKLLLDRRADPSAIDLHGNTPLIAAALKGHSEIVELLLRHGVRSQVSRSGGFLEKQLVQAVLTGHTERAKSVLLAGAQVDPIWPSEPTPLILAVGLGHADIVKMLLAHGADCNRSLKDGTSPLTVAASAGRARETKMLLEAGADPNFQDGQGNTPLMCAAQCGHSLAAKVLVDAGCDIDRKNAQGRTALMCAAQNNRAECVGVLSVARPALDAQDNNGDTALIIGARNGYLNVVAHLASKHVAADAQNKRGNTALMEAARNGHQRVVKYLLEQGADPHIPDWEGKTALKVACECGRKELVALFGQTLAHINILFK